MLNKISRSEITPYEDQSGSIIVKTGTIKAQQGKARLNNNMNKQEKTLYFRLTVAQGSYYVLIGFFIILFPVTIPHITESLILEFNSLFVGSLIVGIGGSLYAGKKYTRVPLSFCILGLVSSGSILFNQVNAAFARQPSLFQSVDIVVELAFIGLWVYLAYWKWVNRQFSKLDSEG
ncbi:hypothetical protein J2X69_000179 [Algoriphagus sp. 4150]|uniref:hypothetical protein n=1 Tax=Algoriphagus sp. 4150 TaxID=2817756 RepID=UPI002856B521|nr:hypothetical protein [Algoriphagus sp. 4150]MDR7127851.1 hypothetical protein [Algoriphagus sp. 4150]